MLINKIKKIVKEEAEKLLESKLQRKVNVEYPAEEKNGNFSTNAAMVLFNLIHLDRVKNPRDLAVELKNKFEENVFLKNICDKIEVAGPGFINFYLKDVEIIRSVFEKKSEKKNNQKIIIEFTDPNPFKQFHIGHVYSNSVGESLCRVYEYLGYEVKRANYQGDVGMHVAKAVWGMTEEFKNQEPKIKNIKELEEKSLKERIRFLGQAYATGAKAYQNDKKAKREIKEINILVYLIAQKMSEEEKEWKSVVFYQKFLKKDKSEFSFDLVDKIYRKGRKWSLEYFEKIYQKLGTKFDYYFFESKTGEYGLKIVREFLAKGVFEKSQGAVVYKGEKVGLHTRVFVNNLDLPTYEAKDLGLAFLKDKKYKYDKSIIVTANEVDEYFKVVLSALSEIKPELAKKTQHISHGVVRLPTGKMSSRTGKIITGDWLIEEMIRKVFSKMKKNERDELDGNKKEIAEKIAVGAIKYALLKNNIGGDIVFDMDKSLSISGNSGAYIQYTYARCRAVIRKCRMQNTEYKIQKKDGSYEMNKEEKAILKWALRFEDSVYQAGENYQPSVICTFLYELCQRFNSFYNKHRIIENSEMNKTDYSERENFRISLTKKVSEIVATSLELLGIKVVERM